MTALFENIWKLFILMFNTYLFYATLFSLFTYVDSQKGDKKENNNVYDYRLWWLRRTCWLKTPCVNPDYVAPKYSIVSVTFLYFPKGLLREKAPVRVRLLKLFNGKFRATYHDAYRKYIDPKFDL